MKIVLDTNVIVSGFLKSKGNPAVVLSLALSGTVQVCHDERILAEYTEVLARRRFKFDPKRVGEVMAKLTADGIAVTPPEMELELPDPDDEAFLAVALAGAADFLVTGNVADYPSDKCRGVRVATPAEFVFLWRKRFPESPERANPRPV